MSAPEINGCLGRWDVRPDRHFPMCSPYVCFDSPTPYTLGKNPDPIVQLHHYIPPNTLGADNCPEAKSPAHGLLGAKGGDGTHFEKAAWWGGVGLGLLAAHDA